MLELFKVIALQSYTHKNCNFHFKASRLITHNVNNQPMLRNCPNLTLTFCSFCPKSQLYIWHKICYDFTDKKKHNYTKKRGTIFSTPSFDMHQETVAPI